MSQKETLWEMDRHTAAKHTILRKYLDAWIPILGGGRYAREDLVLRSVRAQNAISSESSSVVATVRLVLESNRTCL